MWMTNQWGTHGRRLGSGGFNVLCWQRSQQGHRCPTTGRDRNKLILSVRITALKIFLKRFTGSAVIRQHSLQFSYDHFYENMRHCLEATSRLTNEETSS